MDIIEEKMNILLLNNIKCIKCLKINKTSNKLCIECLNKFSNLHKEDKFIF
jgi:hypothetical protein